ncbi:unknown [Bacteroides sp. CAG:462]|nr:unknown [Bacteroides sp. CAG:462]
MKRTIISTLLLMLMTQVSIGQTLKTYSGLYEGGPTRIRLTVGRSNLQAFQRLSIM